MNDLDVVAAIAISRDDFVMFCHQKLTEEHPRDDYKELLELALIFVGETPSRGVHFRKPGSISRARWMMRLIYAYKIYLFKHQFNITAEEETGLRNLCIFGVMIYIKHWYQSDDVTRAPNADLQLMQSLVTYENIHADISTSGLRKICGQLWYLSEELVMLALFDKTIPTDIKRSIVVELKIEPSDDEIQKKASVNYKDVKSIMSMTLKQFVTKNSLNFFNILGLNTQFLDDDPELWNTNPTYIHAEIIVNNLMVTNDIAERGVKLMSEFNSLLARDEQQKQSILHVVSEHRKLYSDCKKQSLNST